MKSQRCRREPSGSNRRREAPRREVEGLRGFYPARVKVAGAFLTSRLELYAVEANVEK
jgi:hypothetical protein